MIPQLDIAVLRRELAAIRERRLAVFARETRTAPRSELAEKVARAFAPELGREPAPPDPAADVQTRLAQAREQFCDAHVMRPVGLAFSGGGIRSATFNLGVMQGLAERGLLKYVDYLSTVSGGGYIGSWLHGLVRSHGGRIEDVERLLSPATNPVPSSPQHDPVTFLRKYSNYLAPRPGLFGADSWVIVSIWIRNVLLNQLILVPSLCAAMLLLVIVGFVQQAPAPAGSWWRVVQAAVALGSLLVAAVIAGINLRAVKARTQLAQPVGATPAQKLALRNTRVIVPLILITSVVLACGGLEQSRLWSATVAVGMLGLFLLFQLTGGFRQCYVQMRYGPKDAVPRSTWAWATFHVCWMAPLCAIVTTALIFALWGFVLPETLATGGAAPWIRVAVGPPLMCISLLTGVALLIGLMGVDYPDAAREWIARVGALLLLACLAWVGLFAIAVFGPYVFALLVDHYALTAVTAVGAWGATTAAGVIAGRSSRTDGGGGTGAIGSLINALTTVAPPAFMVGYLLILACLVHLGVRFVSGVSSMETWVADATPTVYDLRVVTPQGAETVQVNLKATAPPEWLAPLLHPVVRFERSYWRALQFQDGMPVLLLGMLGGLAVIAGIASWRININEFSLHHFYKNRLVRCYLGASNGKRDENRFTGFDPCDDFPLSAIEPGLEYTGPYAIVNAAVNLNTGSELAQQERKAASFVFTPARCGFQPTGTREDLEAMGGESGYCETRGFTSPEGVHLGTTMAISGAAANPNAGYHTSAPMAFLLTVFDARLGWWLGNPRHARARKKPGPTFAWAYLFSELFGMTDARTAFVNVSDGGHFENLGLYELVRRRCRYIIVGDGEQDRALTFEGLGSAVRKCRADFGVEISINPEPLRLVNGQSRAHCVVGTIRYPEQEAGASAGLTSGPLKTDTGDAARGWILYLKSTITGDEPADVTEYRSKHKEFPHESTGDQFFSESQFESYRRLGLHIVRDVFEGVDPPGGTGELDEMLHVFQQLTRKWYAPIPVTDETATRLADSYSSLLRLLSENQKPGEVSPLLPRFDNALVSNLGTASRVQWLEAIQLMQNVFTEFALEVAANRANPRNEGWMNVFRRWASSHEFYNGVWKSVRDDYNPVFQQFVDDLHRAKTDDWPEVP